MMFGFPAFCVIIFITGVFGTCPNCDVDNCKLPGCRCTDTRNEIHPANMADKPQVVLITFDDAVHDMHWNDFFQHILDHKNPNGCPIGATFFVSHKYTNYEIVHELWRRRAEIALHSFTHNDNQHYWETINATQWAAE